MTISHLSILMFAASAIAQSVAVFPPDHANREGSSSTSNLPLASGISRVQIIHSNFRSSIPNGAQIRRIGLRPDVNGTGTGRSVQLEILMGHAATTTLNQGASSTFSTNYLAPAVTVYTPKVLTLPTVPSVAAGPQANIVWIPLDTPFTYDRSKNLVVEYRVSANSNGNASFPYALDSANAVASSTTFGAGCRSSGGTTPSMNCSSPVVGSSWDLTLGSAPSNSAGVLLIGVSNTSFGSVPLPRSLADLGAPSCSLLVSPDVMLSVQTINSSLRVVLSIPNVPPMAGHTIYAQSAVADVFANTMGAVTSNGVSGTLGVTPQSTAIVATGSTTAQTGTRSNGFGLVSLFEY